jgi:pimeloyl-ACP methyl ester carboxylesterase
LLTDSEIGVYVRAYSRPGALRGAFEDYRAAMADVMQDKYDEHSLLDMPTLVLWGEDFAAGGKLWDFR